MALDEAHIIRNPSTSVSQGAASLSAGVGGVGVVGGWLGVGRGRMSVGGGWLGVWWGPDECGGGWLGVWWGPDECGGWPGGYRRVTGHGRWV